MQHNNYPELISQMDALGLGKDPSLHLLNGVYRQLPYINLHFRNTFGADQVDAFLHFTEIEESGNYLFTHWDLEVRNTKEPVTLKQTFDLLGKQDSVTLMEGYNLLQGRSIYKNLTMQNGEKSATWCALDFQNTDRNGNFTLKLLGNQYNLEGLALRYPIKELQKEPEKSWLIQALEEGRCVPITIQKENGEQKVYVEAAPKFNTIKFYDSDQRQIVISKEVQNNRSEKRTVRQAKEPSIRPNKLRL